MRPGRNRRTIPLLVAGCFAAIAAVVIALVLAGGGSSQKESDQLSAEAFASFATSATLIDVRTPAEFASGHLAGAINMDVQAADFRTRLDGMDHRARYAVYCHSGNRSAVALGLMKDAGFTQVRVLVGGITAWTAAGRPTTTQ